VTSLLAIAAGPDGNMWFTDAGYPSAIGRITPSGQITEFNTGVPGNARRPSGIAAGADGNMWFTDPGQAVPGETRVIGSIGTGVRGASVLAGAIEQLTCKTVTKHVSAVNVVERRCDAKLVSGVVRFATAGAARASLDRGRVAYATGVAPRTRHGTRLLLTPHRLLRPGRYTLRLAGHKPASVTIA
jgi:sugar lactone lactonase YvrE